MFMQLNEGNFNDRDDFKVLMKNRNYLTLVTVYTLLFGIYGSMTSVVDKLVSPYGYTSDETSIFGATLILSGILSSVLYSAILDRT